MRLQNVDTGELAEFKGELISRFLLAVDMVGGGIQEFVNLAMSTDVSQVGVKLFSSF